jgi:hypothetical protein
MGNIFILFAVCHDNVVRPCTTMLTRYHECLFYLNVHQGNMTIFMASSCSIV